MEGLETVKQINQLFTDILLERRSTSDFEWASRKWEAKMAYQQLHKSSPNKIKSIVLNSYTIKNFINQYAKSSHLQLLSLVRDILEIVGYKRELSVLRWLGLFVAKLLKKLSSAVYVNEAKFLQIKSDMGSNPVLFVPSHRSYADFILMSYVCFHYEVDIPRIAAGMDFQSMAFMGSILRDVCAFFMKRSFTNDELYLRVFSQYVQTLVTHGDASIEFFIEGTRSRTGKSLMPKYGFLSMALKPFFIGMVPDVTIIPVNLSYDRVLEEILFAYELLGIPKPKESTKGFLKALSVLNESYGNIYIQFGNPFSVKKYFGNKIDRSVHGTGSVHLQSLTPNESKQIINLAHTIVREQRNLTILNCFNLIALALNNNIIKESKCMVLKDLISEVKWLISIFQLLCSENSTIALNGVTKENIEHHLELHKSLIFLSKSEKIYLRRIHSRNAVIDLDKLKGHTLSNKTMDIAIPLLMLQFYVNPSIHYIISVGFIVLIIKCMSVEGSISKDMLFREFQFLCSIFLYEFVFHKDFIEKDFETAFKHSQQLNVIISDENDVVRKGDNNKLEEFCINIFGSYIPGYIVLAEILLESEGAVLTEKEILRSCQAKVEKKLSSGFIRHPANLSLDMLWNALQAFTSSGSVLKIRENDSLKYRSKEELKDVVSKFSIYNIYGKTNTDLLNQFSVFVKGSL